MTASNCRPASARRRLAGSFRSPTICSTGPVKAGLVLPRERTVTSCPGAEQPLHQGHTDESGPAEDEHFSHASSATTLSYSASLAASRPIPEARGRQRSFRIGQQQAQLRNDQQRELGALFAQPKGKEHVDAQHDRTDQRDVGRYPRQQRNTDQKHRNWNEISVEAAIRSDSPAHECAVPTDRDCHGPSSGDTCPCPCASRAGNRVWRWSASVHAQADSHDRQSNCGIDSAHVSELQIQQPHRVVTADLRLGLF